MADSRKLRIAIVAGEVSGDLLGADLINAFQKNGMDAEFYGIGGPAMIKSGFKSYYDMERLSVMGLVEVIGRLRELLRIRKELVGKLVSDPPDAFVGIDAPDFNTDLELKLRSAGIPTIHYVSPTVWAWRPGRIDKIKRAVDHMLVLFPFEEDLYRKKAMRVTFVGHPAANETPENIDRTAVRKKLGLDINAQVLALLPGSRTSEISRLTKVYVNTIIRLSQEFPDLVYTIPFVKPEFRDFFSRELESHGIQDLPIFYFDQQSRDVLAAADLALLASGTAALESAVVRTPMVVTYKMNFISMWLIRKFAHVKLYSMPNNLAGYELVPEYIQERATADNITGELAALLRDESRRKKIRAELEKIYQQLRCDSGTVAMQAIIEEIGFAQNNKT